jgi:asparagine synthase (glutamine-hydrolysing)
MCGIAGKIDFGGLVDEEILLRMCTVMEHRGPDSRGVHVSGEVGLGIQRLAIIDVAGGDQPISNEDGTIVVVMNGEIYNYQHLRWELQRRGHTFSTRSDTEVLVHLYEDHGQDMVKHLRGMFAFAIWDSTSRALFCARDRVGKKPFFWSRRGSTVWFASEVRALLEDPDLPREPDLAAIAAYLTLAYVPHPMSAFSGVRKLPPASTLTVRESGDSIGTYWSLDYTRKLDASSERELGERLWDEISEATRIRLMSEVPLGAFLSGGIDSSAVVAAMAEHSTEPVKTFSIGFPDAAYDELGYARLTAERFGTDHHDYVVEPKAVEIAPKLALHYGEPFADSSAIPSFYLAELTSRHVTVALNGDGGDESFAGYNRYKSNALAAHLNWLPRPLRRAAPAIVRPLREGPHSNSTRTRIARLARSLAMTPAERYAMWMSTYDATRRQRLLTPEFVAETRGTRAEDLLVSVWGQGCGGDETVDRMLATDVQTYLPGDLLVKMDIATMAYSVEVRSPLLDHHVMEFAAAIPAHLKLRGLEGKRILKMALRGRLPDEILDRPKMGFGVPLARWFREDLRALPEEVLLDPVATRRGYFRPGAIEAMIAEHRSGHADHASQLWVLLQLELWHREVLETRPSSALARAVLVDGGQHGGT